MRRHQRYALALVGLLGIGAPACRDEGAGDKGDSQGHAPRVPATPATKPFPPADGSEPVVTVRGVELTLNPDDRELSATLWREGIWEPTETDAMLEALRPGDTFVDVGANIGYYTMLAAQRVGPEGRVFAFEPDPESYAILVKNVARAGFDQVVTIPKAAGAEPGELELFLSTANRGDHRSYDPGGRPSVKVEMIRLDDYFVDVPGSLHMIKLDTRGAECTILQGMRKLLAAHPETHLFVAFYPSFLRAMGSDPHTCFGVLVASGFGLEVVRESSHVVEPISLSSLVAEDRDAALRLRARAPAG